MATPPNEAVVLALQSHRLLGGVERVLMEHGYNHVPLAPEIAEDILNVITTALIDARNYGYNAAIGMVATGGE